MSFLETITIEIDQWRGRVCSRGDGVPTCDDETPPHFDRPGRLWPSPEEPLEVTHPDVVVVGFGFAGALATAELLKAGRTVTVVEPTASHQFLTRLAAVAGGTQAASDRAAPISEMYEVPVVAERAVAVAGSTVELASGRTLDARCVLLTAGARPVDPPIEGLHHALPLRSAEDAVAIRACVATSDSVVIVGGGPTGCQLAGAISVARPTVNVTLVDGSERLMTNFGRRLGDRAADILLGRGVELILGDEADTILPDGAMLESGRRVSGTVLWAAGFEAVMDDFGPTDEGRLIVDGSGLVEGSQCVFAAGDAAAHRDADGEAFPMSAQIASQAGKQIAANIGAVLDGRSLEPLDLRDRGWVVDLGGVGVAELLGVPLAFPVTDHLVKLMHDAIDARHLWQLGGLDFVRRFRPGAMDDRPGR